MKRMKEDVTVFHLKPVAAAVMIAASGSALAQTDSATDEARVLEEIIVTADASRTVCSGDSVQHIRYFRRSTGVHQPEQCQRFAVADTGCFCPHYFRWAGQHR